MEISHLSQEYIRAVKDIKSAILKSRYMAAKKANKELLKLYDSVGGYVSAHTAVTGIGVVMLLRPYPKDYSKNCQGCADSLQPI